MKLDIENREKLQSCVADDEIDLVQLVQILLKRKVMIIAITLVTIILAVGVCFILPKVYEVTTILESATDTDGKTIVSPQTLRENIVNGTYDQAIIEQLSLSKEEEGLLNFKVSVPKSTKLVKISLQSAEPPKALSILTTLLSSMSDSLQLKLKMTKDLFQDELNAAIIKQKSIPALLQTYEENLQQIKTEITALEKSRKTLKMQNANDAVKVLLYSNEIQNQQIFLKDIQRKIIDLKEEEHLANIEVSTLRLKLTNIKGARVSMPPKVSAKPIKPKKKLIVVLAAMIGLMGGVVLAFGAEFMKKVRESQ